SRSRRSWAPGHAIAVDGTSFSDSPVPTPSTTRPGNIEPSVPKACATIEGWYRKVGVATLVPITTRRVLAPSAPSQASEFGAWPSVCFHGWKWSLTNTESKPTSSARREKSKSSRGPNCSAEALYPSFSTCRSYESFTSETVRQREFIGPPASGRHAAGTAAVRSLLTV